MTKTILTFALALVTVACGNDDSTTVETQCFNGQGAQITCPTDTVPTTDSGTPTTDGGTDPNATDGGTDPSPYDIPANAPVYSVRDGELLIAKQYLNGSCAEVRGTLPNTSWTDGQKLSSGSVNGFFGLDVSLVRDGNFEVTAEVVDCGTGNGTGNWADYGTSSTKLKAIEAEGRAYILCERASCVNPGSCKTRIAITTVNGKKRVGPAGNLNNASDCN